VGLALAVWLAAVAVGGVPTPRPALTPDPPLVSPPKRGGIRGKLGPGSVVSRLYAVGRASGSIYSPAEFDARTGEFAFRDLPGDAAYDLGLVLKDGRVIEGIDLRFVDARLLRLAALRRRQLGLPPEREEDFVKEDARDLLAFVRDLKDFMEVRRVLFLRGHGKRATMLVELMRTREFYAAKGDMIWRVELWYFVNQFGGWERVPNQERVLRRERLKPDAWRTIDISYYPRLSVYVSPEGEADPVGFEIPKETDPSRGRPAGAKPELETTPHLLGLDEPSSRPTADE